MLDFVDEMRPKVLFFENVKNLVGHDKGNTFKIIKKEIVTRNYSFHARFSTQKIMETFLIIESGYLLLDLTMMYTQILIIHFVFLIKKF